MIKILPDGEGSVCLDKVAQPELFENSARCRMQYSLISAGTERGIINSCRGKSLDEMRQQGVQLGYTGAGVVEEVRGGAMMLKPGQRVAYYGAPWVSHSEQVVVPRLLVFPLPENVPSEWGAFVGLGAISLHGFRQGNARLGDVCLVAGAGIIGNLCAQFCARAGCQVVVTDLESSRLEAAAQCLPSEADAVCLKPDDAPAVIQERSEGRGADAIYLCMATQSPEPIRQAIQWIRPGGIIVIVGLLDIQIPREPMFMKEAEIRVSRAGGPGRYDMGYERDGADYPYQYVRWTEGRNCAESIRMMSTGQLIIAPLLSHIHPVAQFQQAYSDVVEGKADLGHILDWREGIT